VTLFTNVRMLFNSQIHHLESFELYPVNVFFLYLPSLLTTFFSTLDPSNFISFLLGSYTNEIISTQRSNVCRNVIELPLTGSKTQKQ